MSPKHFSARPFDRDAPTWKLMPETGIGSRILYRFYDAEQQPLYIGITHTGHIRLASHKNRSEWWSLAAYVAISTYPDWSALEEAETAAIRAERPRFNKAKTLWRQRVVLRLDADPNEVADELHRIARPEFIRELGLLLTQPDRYPQPTPPPTAFPVEEG